MELSLKNRMADAVKIQRTFSPPAELQGRGGALLAKSYDKTFHHCWMVLYPRSGKDDMAEKTNTALYAWANFVQSQLPLRVMTNFCVDANDRLGTDGGQYFS